MRDADNENEPFTFQTLAAVTARLLNLDEKQNEKSETDRARGDDEERRANQQREYVEQRLREVARFERRARGGQKPT